MPLEDGVYPIEAAIRNSEPEIVEQLIAHGAELTVSDDKGLDALSLAFDSYEVEVRVVAALLEQQPPVDVNALIKMVPCVYSKQLK